MPTIIRGGTVVNHDYWHRANVLVDGEMIVAIGFPLDVPARRKFDLEAAPRAERRDAFRRDALRPGNSQTRMI